MPHEYEMVEGDNAAIRLKFKKKTDGTPFDLTGHTTTLRWLDVNGNVINKTMTAVPPATDGIAEYMFDNGEVYSSKMRFGAEIKNNTTNKVVRSLKLLEVSIRPLIKGAI